MGAVTEVVAHRGSSADVPEHTLAAYEQAVTDGADALECDVRLTADGHLVCVHDRRIDRTSDGRGIVSTMTLSDLDGLDFGAWYAEQREERADAEAALRRPLRPAEIAAQAEELARRVRLAGRELLGRRELREAVQDDEPVVIDEERHGVLTLERLLELVVDSEREVGLAIETKHPTRYAGLVEERTVEMLRRFGLARPRSEQDSRIRIMSFSQLSARRVRALAPGLPTVFLMERVPLRFRDGSLPFGARIAGPSIDIVRAYPRYVQRLHDSGNEVHVWTVDELDDVDVCVRAGVDAVITNRPRAVLGHLGRTGS
mgnify:CR=1 FL=1